MTNRLVAFFLAVISLVLAPATWAQSDEPVAISIDQSQPLSDALQSFADQTDLQVIFFADIAEGKVSSGLDGEYLVESALDTLLADTGLSYTFIDDTAVSVQAVTMDQGGDSNSKNLGVQQPMLMSQNMSQTVTSTETGSRTEVGGTSFLTGKVIDARTGANLKGAKVTIEETGQWTSTNDLGEFRFVNVPSGWATLTVSYLGYAAQSAVVDVRGDSVSQSFALRGGTEMEEIVVFGQRSARALALNLERAADNFTTIVSSDMLGNFEGTTISEALRRAPGVAFQRDAETGEGTNIIVRGLEPDLNTVKLNGIELPEPSGVGRSASLNNVLADSVSDIRISKTLLANQDSSGTGGLVEITTKSPLDRPDRFLNFLVEGGQRADDDFGSDFLLSGTASGTFGAAENLGLSASVQYRENDIERLQYGLSVREGEFLPLQVDGQATITSIEGIDPRLTFPFEDGADRYFLNSVTSGVAESETSNLSIGLSGALKLGGHTDLRFDAQRLEAETTTFAVNSTITAIISYLPRPVAELGGEERRALTYRDRLRATQDYFYNPDIRDETNLINLRGDTKIDNWELNYAAGYAVGENYSDPRSSFSLRTPTLLIEADQFDSAAIDPVEGLIISPLGERTGDGFPDLSLLPPSALAQLQDIDTFIPDTFQNVTISGQNEKSTLEFDTKYNFEYNRLKYVQVGVQYEKSTFEDDTEFANVTGGVTLAELPLSFSTSSLDAIGVDQDLLTIDRSTFESFARAVTNSELSNFVPVVNEVDPRLREDFTEEEELAIFAQVKFEFGDVDIIGGVRYSQFDVVGRNLGTVLFLDEDFMFDFELGDRLTGLSDDAATIEDFLPRLLVNYRPRENAVFRFGYFKSIARPRIEDISSQTSTALLLPELFGPNNDQAELSVFKGNPGLEPAKTDNFDISGEYYFDDAGVIKVGVFYKSIDNFLQTSLQGELDSLDGINLPDDPVFRNLPENLFVLVQQPINSEDAAKIWGFEVSAEKQLTFLPGVFSGLGIFANYTYSDSSRTELVQFNRSPVLDDAGNVIGTESIGVEIDDARFDGQPTSSGTIGITYNRNSIDSVLSYVTQDRIQNRFLGNGLSAFTESVDSLDFRFEYRPELSFGNGSYRVWVEGTDLLKGSDDPGLFSSRGGEDGTPKVITAGRYFGGRSLRAGIALSF